MRLITRGGYDWTDCFPWIVEAALKNRHQQFVIDGEAVLLGVDGISDFNGLHSRLFCTIDVCDCPPILVATEGAVGRSSVGTL